MKCYLCDSMNFVNRAGSVRDNPALEIVQCVNCSLVFLDSFSHINSGHYENSGMHGDNLLTINSWMRETDKDDQRRFEMLKSHIINKKVLDFGSGVSGFINKAKVLASVVAGVELEKRVRKYWGDKLSIYHSLSDIDSKYDLITSFHVIEHLTDPRQQLKELANYLTDNGRIVIEVPNSEDILLTLYDNKAFQQFTYWSQHLFLFNAETLRRLAYQANLKIISIQQFQRYPISNHLYWMSNNKPGGHSCWSFLDTPELNAAYTSSLAALGKCDTIIAHLEKK